MQVITNAPDSPNPNPNANPAALEAYALEIRHSYTQFVFELVLHYYSQVETS